MGRKRRGTPSERAVTVEQSSVSASDTMTTTTRHFLPRTWICTRVREILPSDNLGKKTRRQLHIHQRWFFILDFPDGPVALWGIRDDRFVFPLQTAEFELCNGPTDDINRYQSRFILRCCFPTLVLRGVQRESLTLIYFMTLV